MNALFNHCEFVLGVAGLDQLPAYDRPEVAFAGRSNVGKSSLLNALTNRKTLAKTSNTPGRTQQLNFFNLGQDALYLVDMPGYGYAKVSKSLVKNWTKLMRSYMKGRPNLRCVFILIDARHGMKDSDKDLMTMLDETAVPYRIILTKVDKVKDEALVRTQKRIEKELKNHVAAFPEPMHTSAHKNIGLDDIRDIILSFTIS